MHHTTYILPNITGDVQTAPGKSGYAATGAIRGKGWGNQTSIANIPFTASGTVFGMDFDASRSSSIYGASENVTPENYAVQYFIKY